MSGGEGHIAGLGGQRGAGTGGIARLGRGARAASQAGGAEKSLRAGRGHRRH